MVQRLPSKHKGTSSNLVGCFSPPSSSCHFSSSMNWNAEEEGADKCPFCDQNTNFGEEISKLDLLV